MKKPFLILMATLLILCAGCSGASSKNSGKEQKEAIGSIISDADNKYITMVKGGYRENGSHMSYDLAFSTFFGTPHWRYFKSTDGSNVVEFTGDCMYQSAKVKARIQFVVDDKSGTFEATYLSFGEDSQDLTTLALLIEMAFDVDIGSASHGSDSANESNSANGSDSNSLNAQTAQRPNFSLALVANPGSISDGSYNQATWEGIERYNKEFDTTCKHYTPASFSENDCLDAISRAVQDGANVVITTGYLFEVPVFIAQDRYPDVKFILLDGLPNNGNYNDMVEKVSSNTVSILYTEEQAGFLAGYAAVKEGYRKLGFLGGMAVPFVIRYGHGFVQGAEYAAQELNLSSNSIAINYYYTGIFVPSPDIEWIANDWYGRGVEAIFVCGGAICFSVFPEAERYGYTVIGVDIDQFYESPSVITSAVKMFSQSVYDCLVDYGAGTFKGGRILHLSASDIGVGLPMETSRFRNFSKADYDAIYAKLANGTVRVDDNIYIAPYDIPTRAVNIIDF